MVQNRFKDGAGLHSQERAEERRGRVAKKKKQ